ncbi:MAG TPA: caspase family protein [Pyrinomonadaceae bacterium]|nr:caspase family protein [Pyrinomonadaceae bacterium]
MKYSFHSINRLLLVVLLLSLMIALTMASTIVFADPQPTQTKQPQSRQLQQISSVETWPSKPKRWALVIGVDKYADTQITTLGGSSNDAKAIADALVRYAGFPSDQVMLLASDQPAERQPTRGNILRRLSNLASVVSPDGLLFVSFAGHGMERGGQAFLLPADAQVSNDVDLLEQTAVNVAQMKDRIRKTGVGQVVLVIDACRNDPVGRSNEDNNLTPAYVRAFNFDLRNREVTAFATLYATAVGQRAYEYKEKQQGYFTWELVEGLKGGAANERGEVTLAGLLRYVQERVPKHVLADLGAGKEQKPFAEIGGYQAEQLVIAVSAKGNATSNTTSTVGPNDNQPPVSRTDPAAFELAYWDAIKNSTDPKDFKSYLDKYPNGHFAELARRRIAEKPAEKPIVERPAATRRLLFKDDFVGLSDAEPLFAKQYNDFKSANGVGQLTGRFAGILPVMYRNLDLRDFVAEFDIRNPNPAKSSAGLLFRRQMGQGGGFSSYYAVGLGFVTPTATLFCFKNGSWPVVQEFPLHDVAQTASGFHRVRLEVAGEKLRLFVDDKLAFDFTDDNVPASGGFGLFITSNVASPSTVQIANLRIYAVEP